MELTQNTLRGSSLPPLLVTGAGDAFSGGKMLEIWDFRFRKTAPRSRKRAPTAKNLFFREGRAPGAHVEHRCGTPQSFLVVAAGELFLVLKLAKNTFSAPEKRLPGHKNELRLPKFYFSVRVGHLEPT